MTNPAVHWLIEDGPFEDDIDPILVEINKQGYPLKIVKYSPFESINYKYLYTEDACVVFYGSINLARQLQRNTPWVPGAIVNFNNYKCSTYYSYWGKHLLNKDYIMLPYAELSRRRQDIYKILGISGSEFNLFIRPDDGCKSFGGHVVYEKDFKIKGGPVGNYAKPESLIIASSPKIIEHEWRVVICDRKAISACQYKLYDKLNINSDVPGKVYDKANEIASSEWQPDRIYVLDIGNVDNRKELKLIEANSFCCSGLYCCDPQKIIKEASRVAIEEWKDIFDI